MAWGRGLLPNPTLPGPRKREGDQCAPAGLFSFGTAFGYAKSPPVTRMAYLPLTSKIVAVDDPGSRFYNSLVDKSHVTRPDWTSAEKMMLPDQRYKWGLVVQHNVPPQAKAGSCIFLHVWKNPETPTVGCTAMPEEAMLRLIRWLDPQQNPVLIQLPLPVYEKIRSAWHLP